MPINSNSLRLSGNSDADKLAIYKAVPFVGTPDFVDFCK